MGKHTLRLAVYPYGGDHVSANVANRAAAWIAPVYAVCQPYDRNTFVGGRPFVQASDIPMSFFRPLEAAEVVVPLEQSIFKMTESVTGAAVLSAFKAAEDGDGYVIRFYNCSEREDEITLSFCVSVTGASLVDLAEKNIKRLDVLRGRKVTFKALPKRIVTLKITCRK